MALVEYSDNILDWEKLQPNFIYNRFDLMNKDEVGMLKYKDEKSFFVSYSVQGKNVELGCWLMDLTFEQCDDISNFLFKNNKNFKRIRLNNVKISVEKMRSLRKRYVIKNDFHIELPQNIFELESRLSKKNRYNIRREKSIAQKMFGEISVENIKVEDPNAEEFVEVFFEFKQATHNVKYLQSPREYIKENCVSDIYLLRFSEEIVAVLFSCEQTPIVYCENMTYSVSHGKYSPGKILYDEYLKVLISKGKQAVFLYGGENSYKNHYGAIEETVANVIIYRSIFLYIFDSITKYVPAFLWVKLPERIKMYIRKLLRKFNLREFSASV